jgi:hypothetical protein
MVRAFVRVNPHNNLVNLASYHVRVIEDKLAASDQSGITLDRMSTVIAMAFSVEAIINFVGAKKLPDQWVERDRYGKKIKVLEARFGLSYQKNQEPFKTLETLKRVRDDMAHGKPVAETVTLKPGQRLSDLMRPSWSAVTEPGFVLAAYGEVKAFRDQLFKLAKIRPGTTLTAASETP